MYIFNLYFSGLFVFARINCKIYLNLCQEYFETNILKEHEELINKKKIGSSIIKIKAFFGSEYTEGGIYSSIKNSKVLYDWFSLSDEKQANYKSKFYFKILAEIKSSLSNFTLNEYKSNVKVLQSSDLEYSIIESRNEQKFNLIYVDNQDDNLIPEQEEKNNLSKLIFDATSSLEEFSEKVDFGELSFVDESISKKLKIKTLPAVSLIYHNKIDEEGFKAQSISNITAIEVRKLLESVSI